VKASICTNKMLLIVVSQVSLFFISIHFTRQVDGQELLQFVSKEYMSSTNRRTAVKEYCEVEGEGGNAIKCITLHCNAMHCTTLY
jgi:hypothetical protein